MKNTFTLLLIFFLGSACIAQGVFRNQTNSAVEKVVQDYPSQFKNIKGELLSSTQGSAEFKSNVSIPGAVSTTITQSAIASKQLVSWQSVVFSAREFSTAKSHFEEVFNQIKNTIIKPEGGKAVIVNGMYSDPSEDKTVTTIEFDLLPATGVMQKLSIDLTLKKTDGQWKIILNVYDKEYKERTAMAAK